MPRFDTYLPDRCINLSPAYLFQLFNNKFDVMVENRFTRFCIFKTLICGCKSVVIAFNG
jgi:hypothetical protein